MNTGIQDAHNLGWKLALVVKGQARASLLDSYDAERHAVGKGVLAQTDRATRMGLMTGLLVPVRNQAVRFVTSFEYVRRQIVREAAELTVGYAGGPLCGEHTLSPLGARVGSAAGGETPSVGSRLAFSAGPRPGSRAPDAMFTRSDGRRGRLSEIWSGDAFTLLLFDGRHASAAGYACLAAIAARMHARFGELVRAFVITPRADRPMELPVELEVLHDGGELEARYGGQTECLYLLRPDLYVGFRSQPASADALDAYLAAVLVPRG
jgi:hypothetical protein